MERMSAVKGKIADLKKLQDKLDDMQIGLELLGVEVCIATPADFPVARTQECMCVWGGRGGAFWCEHGDCNRE